MWTGEYNGDEREQPLDDNQSAEELFILCRIVEKEGKIIVIVAVFNKEIVSEIRYYFA